MIFTHSVINSTTATFLPYVLFAVLLLRPAVNRKIFFAGITCYMLSEGMQLCLEAPFLVEQDVYSPLQEAYKVVVNAVLVLLTFSMYNSQHPVSQRSTYSAILKRAALFGTGYTLFQSVFAFGKAFFTATNYTLATKLETAAVYSSINLFYVPALLCCFSAFIHGSTFWKIVVSRDLLNFVIIDSLVRYLKSYHYNDLFFETWMGKTFGLWGSEILLRVLVVLQAVIVSYFGIHSGAAIEKKKHE